MGRSLQQAFKQAQVGVPRPVLHLRGSWEGGNPIFLITREIGSLAPPGRC